MPNLPAFRQVLDDIHAEVFQHDQADYFVDSRTDSGYYLGGSDEDMSPPCGTAMCVAGWAAWRAGWRPSTTSVETWLKDGEERHIDHIASELLGLTGGEADAVFKGTNTIDELEQMYTNLAAGREIDDDGEAA